MTTAEPALLQVLHDLDGWQALAVAVKAMTYGASFAAAGEVMFIACFSDLMPDRENRAMRQFLVRMAWLAIVLSALRIAVLNGMLDGELSGMLDVVMTKMVLQSSEGAATGLRMASLLIIALLCRRQLHGMALWSALLAAFVAATSFALVGHASEVTMPFGFALLPQSLLCLHLLAVAFWLGALPPLHRATHDDHTAKVAAIMERFGRIAAGVVGLLVVAGAVLLWLVLAEPDALWNSAYAQLFAIKLSSVILLLALAARNKLRLTPRLLLGEQVASVRLRRSIKAEMLLAGVILLVTAGFTTLVGPST